MADIRINALAGTATSSASDDYLAIDGAANGTRKLSAYSPAFGGTLDVAGNVNLGTLAGGIAAKVTVGNGGGGNSALILRGGSPQTAFQIGSNINNANALEISPSTAAGGTTFTTTVWRIDGSGNTIQSGNLTVSGTGAFNGQGALGNWGFGLGSLGDTGFYRITNTSPASPLGAQIYLGENNFNSAGYWNQAPGIGSVYDTVSSVSGALALYSYNGSRTERIRVNSAGNVLIGTTTDSSNGKLQLATHTTSAGGIGFGPSTALFSGGSGGYLYLDGANPLHGYTISGTRKAYTQFNPSGSFDIVSEAAASTVRLFSANALALTLDSSQRTILSGALRLNNAYTASVIVPTGYVTIQDSTGTTYKVAVSL